MKIFDSHFHIIDYKYPIVENNGYTPPEFKVEDYLESISQFEIVGGAIVSGSFQAYNQEYLMHSLKTLGNNFFGVTNIPANITDLELKRLNKAKVTAIRFNVKRGGSGKIEQIEKLSNHLFEKYGWHAELYIDSRDLSSLKPVLQNIPQFSIDHLGLSEEGLNDLYYWVEKGVKVKATGFGRIDFDPIRIMKKIHSINPEALMFGTDLPSTRAKIPFSWNDVARIMKNFALSDQERIFYKNAINWYKK